MEQILRMEIGDLYGVKGRYDSLIRSEQEEVQSGKIRTRTLSRYDDMLFKHTSDSDFNDFRKTDKFLENYCGSGVENLEGLISRLSDLRGRPVVWSEMGGGGAIAMRQVTSLPGMREKVVTFNVDILDFDDKKIDIKALKEIATTTPTALRQENKPRLIRSNMEEVVLPQRPDIITSVSSIFYLNNPLEAICSWYNQLNDYGLLVITAKERWSDWIFTEGAVNFSNVGLMARFSNQLKESGIALAVSESKNQRIGEDKGFNLMMVEKKPNTSLDLQTEVSGIRVGQDSFKAVYYRDNESVVRVRESIVDGKDKSDYHQKMVSILDGNITT